MAGTRDMIEGTSSSSTDAILTAPPPAIPPPVVPSEKTSSNKPGGKHTLFTHCPKDTICHVRSQTKITRAPCRRNPEKRAVRLQRAKEFCDIINADTKNVNGKNVSPSTSICSGRSRSGHPMDSMLYMQKYQCS